jgi:small subunit ribosomal protein S21
MNKFRSTDNRPPGNRVYVVNDNVDQALRKFKKKINDSGVLKDLQAREAYEKPSITRKIKAKAARNRWRRKLSSDTVPKKLY